MYILLRVKDILRHISGKKIAETCGIIADTSSKLSHEAHPQKKS